MKITASCGHIYQAKLAGKRAERAARVETLESRLCPACNAALIAKAWRHEGAIRGIPITIEPIPEEL